MEHLLPIRSALISVYHKDGLDPIIRNLHSHGIRLISTGGTFDYIEKMDVPVEAVDSITEYPAIFGGRVKTLHPKIFGGILYRRDHETDLQEKDTYDIPPIDLVIVDLYPFAETVKSGAPEEDIIEKIDIGGISLIRAAAKNFRDVLICSSRSQYPALLELLEKKGAYTHLEDRRRFAAEAFHHSSHYDTGIFNYFNQSENLPFLKFSEELSQPLRYGENPHQQGKFYGDLSALVEQLHGKEISYNNLLDIDAAIQLMGEFNETGFAILKHNNACGLSLDPVVRNAYLKAYAGDPVSAFGGVLITNTLVDKESAEEISKLFFEVLIAPGYTDEALEIFQRKKNNIILRQQPCATPASQVRTLLNGILQQDKDLKTETAADLKTVTQEAPTAQQQEDLLFANKIVKHTKSNAIVLARDKQLLGLGTGHTSRVDALRHAITKAKEAGFSLEGAVMASDAFFPFPDCVEIANREGIKTVIQPGGSVKDQDSIDFCDAHGIAMVFTGHRHFKH